MRKLILGTMVLLFALVQSGCSKSDNNDQTLFANLNWTQDVTEVDMSAFGMDASEITQNKDYKLASGEGTIRWLSDGVSYSKNITVGDSEIGDSESDVECEQDGDHQGENEGCVFEFSFTGDVLTISSL